MRPTARADGDRGRPSRRSSERGNGQRPFGVIGDAGPVALGVALGVVGYAVVVAVLVAVGLFETAAETSTVARNTVIGSVTVAGLAVAAACWSRRSKRHRTRDVVAVALGLVFLGLTLADAHVWGTVEPAPAGLGGLVIDALYHLVGPLIAGWGLYELSGLSEGAS